LSRPVITAFTPLPEGAQMTVASGTKLKGVVDNDNEPTLEQITAAKKAAQQATTTGATAPAAATPALAATNAP
jgi:hypothetical protein